MRRALALRLLCVLRALCAFAAAPQAQPVAPGCPPLPTVDSSPPRDRCVLWRLTRDGRVS